MNLIKTDTFEFEGKEYEIRIHGSAWDFTVRAYLNGKPANGYSYSISLPTEIDLKSAHNLDAVQILVGYAKRDIKQKMWEKYIKAHVASLKKKPKETLGCRKCGSRDISVSKVDERDMFECKNCSNIWYAERQTTSGPLSIIDNITDGVTKNGSHEIDTSILLNFVFPTDERGGPSFQDQLRNWTQQNKLKYDVFDHEDTQYLRFWR